MTSSDHDDDNLAQEVMKQEDPAENGKEVDKNNAETTMTIGSTTPMGGFVQLPPELLTMIFANLGEKDDLLAGRQINKTWTALISPILRQRKFIQIGFDPPDSTSAHQISKVIRLNGCLENSKTLFNTLNFFPCVRFSFSKITLEEENVQMFFNLYGPSIQSLKLREVETTVEEGQLKSLNRLLTQQATSIKSLALINPTTRPEGIPAIPFDANQTKLPHLQTLGQGEIKSDQEKRVTEEIIVAANNLQVYNLGIRLTPFDPLETLMSRGKIHTVKEICMPIEERIDLWETFADMQLTLESWYIEVDFLPQMHEVAGLLARVAAFVNKILESSKKTLTSLDTMDCTDRIPGITFPVLKKLKDMSMTDIDVAEYLKRQNLFNVFPNIKIVTLWFTPECTPLWDYLMSSGFDINSWWPNVHTITIGRISENCFESLSRLFPNLKNLLYEFGNNVPEACCGIFEYMKGLVSLKFYGLDSPGYLALDAALTGFSTETCVRLAGSDEMLEDGEVEKLRKNVSLLASTGLKNLKFTGVHGCHGPILSRVSGIWAFQLLPQLKVAFTACRHYDPTDLETEAALNAIAPFVDYAGFE